MTTPANAKGAEQFPPHILVVDDDTRLRTLLKKFLRQSGYMVSAAANAGEARRQMGALTFDLLVVDVMMPGEDGYALTKTIRATSAVPILMLTAMGEANDRIKGLELGVDDYMAKPFEPKELVLRIGSILRRAPPPAQETSKTELKLGACRYDLARKQLTQDGAPVHLTIAETELLHTLAQKANEAIERSDLGVTEENGFNPRTIDVQITRLRRKIEPDPRQPRYLQTVRGTGYMLRTDP
jgi:two-component system, OmpR family, phosphate regulon response regulator OmpR